VAGSRPIGGSRRVVEQRALDRASARRSGEETCMPKSGSGLESYGATVLRMVLGVIYVMHAYLAAFVYGPQGMTTFQRAQGLPFPEIGTWYVILAHGLGGISLILGVLVRWAALANIPIMAGALFVVHLKQGFFMGKDGGFEYSLLVLGATIAQALLGAGAFTFRR
jgi:putative oxidoreductase